MTEKSVFYVGMLDFTVSFHVVSSRKLLATNGTLMALGPMNVGMMPAIRNGFVATDTTVQCGKSACQLYEQGRIVNVVIATCHRRGPIQAAATTVSIFH